MRKIITTLLIPIMVISCSSNKIVTYQMVSDSLAKYRTAKLIKLDTILSITDRYIEFENMNSRIILRTDKVLNYAIAKKTDSSLCMQKKSDLSGLIDLILNSSNEFYLIESKISPPDYKRLDFPRYKKYKKTFIQPYGYKIETDTTNKVRIETLKHWMISEMCVNGDCFIWNKMEKKYTEIIYYEIIDFKDGHGSEDLKFMDKEPFFNVNIYSDIVWPNFDCMSLEKIKNWNK